jgi:CheY-like chemotaxis protein
VDLEKPAGEAPRGQGETILVVEDDATVRLILADVLTELGYDAVLAADARAAIPILQSDRSIDLMMSDVTLPHINAASWRKSPAPPRLTSKFCL